MATTRTTEQEARDPRVIGGRYRSGYWREEYEVLDIQRLDRGKTWWTVRFNDDSMGRLCTPWDARQDRVIS